MGQLYSVDGEVSVQRHGSWQPAVLNQSLCAQDAVRTGSLSRAAVTLINEAILRIDQNTTVYLNDVATDEQKPSLLDLTRGALQSFSRRPHALKVNTPYLNAAIQGTEFVIRAEAGETTLTTLEGVVSVTNASGSASVASGQSVSASSGTAPRPFILVRPWDAVQWGLYYPPILAISGSGVAGLRPELAASLTRATQHDIKGAFAALDRVPPDERDTTFYLLKAALALSVGRVDAARKIIDQALAQNGRAGLAYALRAVIEVVQNEKIKALADAKRGVALEPKVAATRIALSYAQQANFDLKGARELSLRRRRYSRKTHLPGPDLESCGLCLATAIAPAKQLRQRFAWRPTSNGCISFSALLPSQSSTPGSRVKPSSGLLNLIQQIRSPASVWD